MFLRLRWSALVLLAAVACKPPPQAGAPPALPPLPGPGSPTTAVGRVLHGGHLLRGLAAHAKRGDFFLRNDRVAVLVGGLDSPAAGALLDAGPRATGADALLALAPQVGTDRLARPVNLRLYLGRAPATIRVVGRDPHHPRVRVETRFELPPASRALRLVTTVHNRGQRPIAGYRVVDDLAWGIATAFAPAVGRLPLGQHEVPWLAGLARDVSYAYLGAAALVGAFLHPDHAQIELARLTLAPGAKAVRRRSLLVGGRGYLGPLLEPMLATRGVAGEQLELAVADDRGESLAFAEIELTRDGKPYALLQTGRHGGARVALPPARYALRARAEGRVSPPRLVDLSRSTSVRLTTAPPSQLVFDVRERGRMEPFPCKLSIVGLDGTPTPHFGALVTPRPANTVLSSTGRGRVLLPPGRYRVTASRGPEYSLAERVVTLAPLTGASVVLRLKREVDSSGFVAVDLLQLAAGEGRSALSAAAQTRGSLAEGLRALVTTTAQKAAPSKGGGLLLLRGRMSRDHRAPLVRFPWPSRSGRPGLDLLTTPRHRRPPAGRRAAALLLLDGRRPLASQALAAWIDATARGNWLVAVGGSGSRALWGSEPGYARTYVAVRDSRAFGDDEIVAKLRAGRCIASNGPLLRLSCAGRGPGQLLRLDARARRRGALRLQVEVQAPSWVSVDELAVYRRRRPRLVKRLKLAPRQGPLRLSHTFSVPRPAADGFVVVVARGSQPLRPVTRSPLPALAVANPIWIDADGDGRITLR